MGAVLFVDFPGPEVCLKLAVSAMYVAQCPFTGVERPQ